MSLQDIYQTAAKFAAEAHSSQTLPGSSANYFLHISNVAMEVLLCYKEKPDFDIELAIQIALLHDALEDTEVTPEQLRENFGDKVAKGVEALTKRKDLSKFNAMLDSINRIKESSPEAAIVKLADRITNLQKPPAYWNEDKVSSYTKDSVRILSELGSTNVILKERLEKKLSEYRKFLG